MQETSGIAKSLTSEARKNKMPFYNRKSNRLKGYDYSQNGAYFITVCVKDKKCLLGKVVGGDAGIAPEILLSSHGKTVEKYINGIKGLHKYVIMPNHIHMIVFIENEEGTMKASSLTQSIPQLIRSFKTLVTKELGFSLWQRSYYDHIIRDIPDYEAIWEYIENNPLKWKEDKLYKSEQTK